MDEFGFNLEEKVNKLIATIDKQLVWRKKEINDVCSYVGENSKDISNSYNKMVICLLYSHWEGFARDVMRCFFKFLNQSRLKFKQLNSNFHICAALSQFHGFEGSYALNINYIRGYFDGSLDLDREFSCNLDKFCTTKSNLNSDVLKEICYKIGISYHPFSTKEKFIDSTLLGYRNAIAHGEYCIIEDKDIFHIKHMIVNIMQEFYDDVVDMIRNHKFLSIYP